MPSNGERPQIEESVIRTLSLVAELGRALEAVTDNVADGHVNTTKALQMIGDALDDLQQASTGILKYVEKLEQRIIDLEERDA